MNNENLVAEIESWFADHEDGEFCVLPIEHLSTRTGEFANAVTIIYTTKPQYLAQYQSLLGLSQPLASLGRPGLPCRDDLLLLQNHDCHRIFVGDCDPPDILTFASLREHVSIAWAGVSDAFLSTYETNTAPISIPLSHTERATIPQLTNFCPDFRELVGTKCSNLLDAGFKIELESVVMR